MADAVARLKDASSLQEAIHQNVASINVEGRIVGLPTLNLTAGTHLRGADQSAELHFKEGQPGLILDSDHHHVTGLRLVVDETQVALGLSDDADSLGSIVISDVRTVGRVHLEASQARRGNLKLHEFMSSGRTRG